MKILNLLSLSPPYVLGGAEQSGINLMHWLQERGHDVAAATVAAPDQSELEGGVIDRVEQWRLRWPRPHTVFSHAGATAAAKLRWHIQDVLDPRNRSLMARILDGSRPDFILAHVVLGLGFNGLYEIAKRDIPTIFFLHDFTLACAKADMFRNGKTCRAQCTVCRPVSHLRWSAVISIPRIGFCSPSANHLKALSEILPLERYPTTAIFNANKYPPPNRKRNADRFSIAYVGRLSPTKGVSVLLEAAERLAANREFSLTIVGTGPDEQALRNAYSCKPWCRFTGHVTQQEVTNIINSSDLLCVPSVWSEVLPGVVVQALQLGVPVIASGVGGIPEMVKDGENGRLVPAGDVDALRDALADATADRNRLAQWRSHTRENAYQFQQDHLGSKILTFMDEVRTMRPGQAPR